MRRAILSHRGGGRRTGAGLRACRVSSATGDVPVVVLRYRSVVAAALEIAARFVAARARAGARCVAVVLRRGAAIVVVLLSDVARTLVRFARGHSAVAAGGRALLHVARARSVGTLLLTGA